MTTVSRDSDLDGPGNGAPAEPASAPAFGDPAPLGMGAFAMTTFVLSVFNAGLMNIELQTVVLPLALFYGGLSQVLAGMWAFRVGNTFGGLAFTSFGAFWLSYATYAQFFVEALGAGADAATSLFLFAWAIFSAYMTVAAVRTTPVVLGVFVLLTITLVLLGAASASGAGALTMAGGWAGLLTALVAWYGSAGGVINLVWGRDLLPGNAPR
ncbi:acetate uptake transporter [Saccharopolyspora sp. HNM0983]|uniref:Acetate uptake transporter n=1 Tax=Saccharopolyspora montiporae TaxID=2781240 RepID=A0A929B8I9_9PSEU|nr:acetate uptake transporter [Saccharopolyspora sp. HNM0983]MBE9373158.1 acetate uptake transporter [Saccharopolyspora sp. HNM0983]